MKALTDKIKFILKNNLGRKLRGKHVSLEVKQQ